MDFSRKKLDKFFEVDLLEIHVFSSDFGCPPGIPTTLTLPWNFPLILSRVYEFLLGKPNLK